MKLIVNKDFTLNGSYYFENDEIAPEEIGTIKDISRLNENGFIKPLSLKELIKTSQYGNGLMKQERKQKALKQKCLKWICQVQQEI